jgi:hypothetical protein
VRSIVRSSGEDLIENDQTTLEGKLSLLQQHWGWWLVIYALLLLIQISPWWYPTPDSVAYLSIARSLATGHGLRNLGYLHIAYPPGYPLLLSLAFIRQSFPFLTISIMNWFMALIFLGGLYRWTARLAPEAAPLLTGLTMVNVTFWIYYRRTLTELVFVTVMIWTVNALNRALDARTVRARALFTLIGCGLALYLSMIREVGVLFVAAFAVAIGVCVCQRRLKLTDGLAMIATVAVPSVLAVITFVAYDQSTFEGPRSFLGTHLSGFLHLKLPFWQQVLEGTMIQISAMGRLVVPGMFKAYGRNWLNINTVIYVWVVAGLLVGWLRIVRRRVEVFAYTIPLYIMVYAAWGFDADTRYMLPMLPILVMSAWCLIEPYQSWRLSALTVLLVLHGAVAIGYWTAVEIPRGLECNRQWPEVKRIVSTTESEPGPVATAGKIPECVSSMLSFALDRPVANISTDQAALERSEWVIVYSRDPALLGFQQVGEVNTYKLLRKTSPRVH